MVSCRRAMAALAPACAPASCGLGAPASCHLGLGLTPKSMKMLTETGDEDGIEDVPTKIHVRAPYLARQNVAVCETRDTKGLGRPLCRFGGWRGERRSTTTIITDTGGLPRFGPHGCVTPYSCCFAYMGWKKNYRVQGGSLLPGNRLWRCYVFCALQSVDLPKCRPLLTVAMALLL